MLKIDTQVLVTLRHRFDEQISEADILAWLYNFEESDWGTALTLLNQVSFYSETRCTNVLEDGLQQIIRAHPRMPIAIYPIGGIGKSGVVMAYHIKKIIGRLGCISWSFVDNNFSYRDTPYLVVLLDDFLGSGGSACKLLEQITPNIPQGSVVLFMCCLYAKSWNIVICEKCRCLWRCAPAGFCTKTFCIWLSSENEGCQRLRS